MGSNDNANAIPLRRPSSGVEGLGADHNDFSVHYMQFGRACCSFRNEIEIYSP